MHFNPKPGALCLPVRPHDGVEHSEADIAAMSPLQAELDDLDDNTD